MAAYQGKSLDEADLEMGFDIAERYHGIWSEVRVDEKLEPDQHYKVAERVRRINELGLEVAEVELVPHNGDEHEHLHLKLKVADRHYYSNRLRELTGVDAGEHQARQILSDLQYYEVKQLSQVDSSNPTGMLAKALIAARWRVDIFEPILRRVTEVIGAVAGQVSA